MTVILVLVLTLISQFLADGTAAIVVGDDAGLLAPGGAPFGFYGPPYFGGLATVGFCAPGRQFKHAPPHMQTESCVSLVCAPTLA